MIYSNFINKTSKYLKSVRILKNYVSFDMIFPNSWVVNKKTPEGVEIIETENQEGNVIKSFVSENRKELIDKIENIIDGIIKTNIEREEKEKLFKSKVNELKNIFEKEKLENLKGLKFDLEELTKFIQNEEAEISSRVTEGTELTK
jgi:hypothetical protein